MEEIVKAQNAKLDSLLSITNERLELVEGPRCNRYDPAFNVFNHPYYWGVELRMPPYTFGLFGLF